jgi:hypothetical protein
VLNDDTGHLNKFGGVKKKNIDFELEMELRKPLFLEGYALRTADEGIDPEEWSIFVTQTTSSGQVLKPHLLVASEINKVKREKWQLIQYPFDQGVWCTRVTLKVHKSTSHDTAECQIGQFQLLTTKYS